MRVIQYVQSNSGQLYHHGIKGQRWGVRRFQNEDGTLTSQGKRRYNVNADGTARLKEKYQKKENIKGVAKSAIGAALIGKSVSKLVSTKKLADPASTTGVFTSKSGKKTLNRSVFKIALGTVLVTSSVKNFINANKNKTINTVGQGGTPERKNK